MKLNRRAFVGRILDDTGAGNIHMRAAIFLVGKDPTESRDLRSVLIA